MLRQNPQMTNKPNVLLAAMPRKHASDWYYTDYVIIIMSFSRCPRVSHDIRKPRAGEANRSRNFPADGSSSVKVVCTVAV
jgi:hypothetical protein